MKMFLGIVTGILGIASIVTMFMFMSSVTTFWMVAHIVAGIVLIVDAIYLVRGSMVKTTDTTTYSTTTR